MKEIFKNIQSDLKKQIVNTKNLLTGFRLIDESTRKAAAFTDPTYIPFYYYLGKQIQPKTVIECEVGLGLSIGAFFKSCKSVEKYLGLQEKGDTFYSKRLASKNISSVYKNDMQIYVGSFLDKEFENLVFKTDLAILGIYSHYDNYSVYMDELWKHIKEDGILVVEYINEHEPASKAFYNFCKVKNRESYVFDTRYGVGIIRK